MKKYIAYLLLITNQCFAGIDEGKLAYYTQNYATALKELVPLAEIGNAEAQGILGDMYFESNGLNQDVVKALELYKKSAIQGNDTGIRGLLKMEGQYYTTLLEDFMPLAEAGDKNAQLIIANFFYQKSDYNAAIIWFRKSAEQGQTDAQFRLGLMLEGGKGTLKSVYEAADWFLKSAIQSEKNNPADDMSIGVISLGDLLVQILEQNPEHKGYWFTNPTAQRGIAWSYSSKNSSESIKWFLKAAQQGDISSQKELAQRYYIGNLVAQNYREAFYWFLKAASLGDSFSQSTMAGFYSEGFASIPKNLVLAHMLYNLAGISKRSKSISQQRDEITALLTPEQLDEAQELATKWKIGTPIPTATKTYPSQPKSQRRKK
ncbi:MAG: tetratricopeptide repeat protein [Agitococcus sp.]